MTQVGNPFAPLKASDRIQSLDVMRGIVLFGILIMNINGMGLANAYMDPTVAGGASGGGESLVARTLATRPYCHCCRYTRD